MVRFLFLCASVVAGFVGAIAPAGVLGQTGSPVFPIDPASGITVEVLASAEASWEPLAGVSLQLERVTPQTAGAPFVSNGPELWLAGTESLGLTPPVGSTIPLAPGESTVINGEDTVTAGFGPVACSSALRLVVAPVFAMISGSEVEGPAVSSAPPEDCPEAAILIEGVDLAAPAMPANLVIARFSLAPAAYLEPAPFGGPVGMSVESGTVAMLGVEGVQVSLSAGSSIVANGETPIGITETADAPASLLVAALLPVDPLSTGARPGGGAAAMPDHTSSLFGYTLSWDDSWTIIEDTSAETSERLYLNNGVSDLYIESFGDYGENAQTCVQAVRASLGENPDYANVQTMLSAAGEPEKGGDEAIAFEALTFDYDGETFSGEYAEDLECRVIVPGESVLLVTHFSPLDAYPVERDAVQLVLDTLSFPEQ